MKDYLASTDIINWEHPEISALAKQLATGSLDDMETAQRCFEFVRDEILHSSDHQRGPVTLTASDVLKHKTGYCYAKSHLLAALLRCNGIPAGLCYQRLQLSDRPGTCCLHGLNAVFLKKYGWYRADPRGNRSDVDARFLPPEEHLAFEAKGEGEINLPEIWPEPLPVVVSALLRYNDWASLRANLPDILILPLQSPSA